MVIVPAERSAACDPVVTSTMSSGATTTELVAAIPDVVEFVDGYSSRRRFEPYVFDDRRRSQSSPFAALSQATSGFTNASFWLKGVRITPAMVDRWGNK